MLNGHCWGVRGLPQKSLVKCLVIFVLGVSNAAMADTTTAKPLSGKVIQEWKFDKDRDLQGWAPNSLIRDAAVQGGVLRGRAVGNDPILTGPVFEIAAGPLQWIEISMKATAATMVELYWTETLEGKFGGFSAAKLRTLRVVGDGQLHVYRVWPFWHAAKKIVRLRLDPPNAGEFEISSIRILQAEATAKTEQTAWKSNDLEQSWQWMPEGVDQTSEPVLLSPVISVSADEHPFVCVRIATDQAGSGRLYVVSKKQFGWDSIAFPLRPDGKMHSYNIHVGASKTWQGSVCLLGLQIPASAGTRVESIEAAHDPAGPVELEVTYFGASEGVNRCGRPTGVTCAVKNLGGTTAEQVVATLKVPAGVRVLDDARKTIDRLSLYLPKTVAWQIQAEGPGRIEVELQVEAAGSTVSSRASVELTPAPQVADKSYVPEPKPVACKYDLGAFYFPGWCTSARWEPVRGAPNRKPILGWYDEANPECVDWQIKWAVEHGVKFFMVDWYWSQGNRHLEHWVHDAYMKARYRKYLQWAVMWANHNAPHTHSADDWRKVTQYWIDNYFGMPEYYRIDNRPAVFIWAPSGIRRDLKGTAEAAKLYAMSQEMARKAGYPGIYFVAMASHESAEAVATLKSEGYEGSTSYHGFQFAQRQAGSDYFPYAAVLDTAREVWQQEDERAAGMQYMPIVDTGWDPRPWHGDKTKVALDRTPQRFGELCRAARQYADQTGKRIIAIGPWNEWGEGSYIEPYAEYGFQDLDQLRAAFCEPGNWPPNLVPSDVGRGPYDLPPFIAKTAWEFNTDGDLEGWGPNQIADLAAKGGLLTGRTTGSDPVLNMSGLQVDARQMRHVSFRMRADVKGQVELFWTTTLAKMSGRTRIAVEIPGDGEFHDYEVDLGQNSQWRGFVKAFRLDPAVGPNVNFAIDYIRLH